jgi:predicted dithiol-disulfide oxidoreductase (DUF899 family)
MAEVQLAHPEIASGAEWLAARKELLAQEKAHTHAGDAISARLRRLPMVKIEKDYTFDAPDGKVGLKDLFEGRRQLIAYHFMFDPKWEKGCMGCTGLVNALGDLSMLNERDTSFALVSLAPLAKLNAYKKQMGWDRVWVSSFGTDFNYDFHVTLDESVAPMEYNYRTKQELAAAGHGDMSGEHHGMSVFFRTESDVFHTYSSYGRGCENRTNSYALLDITPYGRQEDWEDSPSGYPQRPTYG